MHSARRRRRARLATAGLLVVVVAGCDTASTREATRVPGVGAVSPAPDGPGRVGPSAPDGPAAPPRSPSSAGSAGAAATQDHDGVPSVGVTVPIGPPATAPQPPGPPVGADHTHIERVMQRYDVPVPLLVPPEPYTITAVDREIVSRPGWGPGDVNDTSVTFGFGAAMAVQDVAAHIVGGLRELGYEEDEIGRPQRHARGGIVTISVAAGSDAGDLPPEYVAQLTGYPPETDPVHPWELTLIVLHHHVPAPSPATALAGVVPATAADARRFAIDEGWFVRGVSVDVDGTDRVLRRMGADERSYRLSFTAPTDAGSTMEALRRWSERAGEVPGRPGGGGVGPGPAWQLTVLDEPGEGPSVHPEGARVLATYGVSSPGAAG